MKKTPTTAVLCIARNEHPYFAQWLEYHFKIGVDRIYVLSTDDDFPAILNLMVSSDHIDRLEPLHYHDFKPGWQMRCCNRFSHLVREDWLLILDLDEFLYLPQGSRIQEFTREVDESVDQVQFPWLLFKSRSYYERSVFDIPNVSEGHRSDHVKSMARTRSVSAYGVHSHRVQGRSTLSSGEQVKPRPRHEQLFYDADYPRAYPTVLHFSSRGYFDTLSRILSHRFFNGMNSDDEKRRVSDFLTQPASLDHVPARVFLSLVYDQMPVASIPTLELPPLEKTIDADLVVRIFLRSIEGIVAVESNTMPDLVDEFEQRFKVKEKMLQLELPGTFDLEAYGQCGSQLGYVSRLRKQLLTA